MDNLDGSEPSLHGVRNLDLVERIAKHELVPSRKEVWKEEGRLRKEGRKVRGRKEG